MAITQLKNDIKIKKKFKDISDSSWDKIIIDLTDFRKGNIRTLGLNALSGCGLNPNNTKLFARRGNWWAFISDDVFNEVRDLCSKGKDCLKSIDTMAIQNSNGIWKDTPLAPSFVFGNYLLQNNADPVTLGGQPHFKSNDFFIYTQYNGRDHGKIRSQQVLKFLKTYCPDCEFDTVYRAGTNVEESEVGLPESTPVPTPAPSTPSTTTGGGGTSGSGGGGGLSTVGGSWGHRTVEAQSAKSTQSGKNSLVLMGLISSVIITITAIAIIWRRKKTKV